MLLLSLPFFDWQTTPISIMTTPSTTTRHTAAPPKAPPTVVALKILGGGGGSEVEGLSLVDSSDPKGNYVSLPLISYMDVILQLFYSKVLLVMS